MPGRFTVTVTASAQADLRSFKAYEQRIIVTGIRTYLDQDAHVPTDKRKQLEPNALAPWELRIDKYRVFYQIDDTLVAITAIGVKDHNDLYIRGKKVPL